MESAGEDTAGFARHVYADLHDISARLDKLETGIERILALIDIYEPQIKRYALMTGMRGMGRGRRRDGG